MCYEDTQYEIAHFHNRSDAVALAYGPCLESFQMSTGRLHGVSQRVQKMEETLSETFALWSMVM